MNNLSVIEYQNQRILTTQQIADAYETDTALISNNFSRNKERYVPGKHYYCLEGEELRAFKGSHQIDDNLKFAPILYLWTEKGALLHAKSLNTDRAWEMYDYLVESYFNPAQPTVINSEFLYQLAQTLEDKERQIAVLTPKAEFFDAVTDSTDAIDIGSAAKVLNMGIGRNKLFLYLRRKGVLMGNNQPYQEYIDRGYFRVIEQKYTKPDGSTHINIKTVVYQKGLDYIRKLYKKPMMLSG